MPLYNCKCCNFSTKIKSHYIRHKNTKKHQANISSNNLESEFMVKSQKEPEKSQKEPKRAKK